MRIDAMTRRHALCSAFLTLFAISLLAFQSLAASGSPSILNYQGILTDDQTCPGGNCKKTMSFRIYDSPAASPNQALWSSGDVQNIEVVNGAFSLNLGADPQDSNNHQPAFPPTLFADDIRYLGVTIDGSELSPRKKLVSVPYALNAGAGIPKGVIVMWSGTVDQIPQGWALCNGENGTPDLKDRFVMGAGTTYPQGSPPGGSPTIKLDHSHTVSSHTHSISSDGNHQHSGNTGGNSDSKGRERGDSGTADDGHHHSFTTDSQGSHSHGGGTGEASSTTDSQLSSSQGILPPYYVLCFIMKL